MLIDCQIRDQDFFDCWQTFCQTECFTLVGAGLPPPEILDLTDNQMQEQQEGTPLSFLSLQTKELAGTKSHLYFGPQAPLNSAEENAQTH